MKRDEQAVQDVMSVIDSMVNPWKTDISQLVSLSSGALATDKVTQDLLKAEEIGGEAAEVYINTRIVPQLSDSESSKTDLFTAIPKLKLQHHSLHCQNVVLRSKPRRKLPKLIARPSVVCS